MSVRHVWVVEVRPDGAEWRRAAAFKLFFSRSKALNWVANHGRRSSRRPVNLLAEVFNGF